MQAPHEFRPGEEFDPSSARFKDFIDEFIRRGGTPESGPVLTDEEKDALQKILNFANRRRTTDPVFPAERVNKDAVYPKYLHDMADEWRGKHPINIAEFYDKLDEKAEKSKECFDTVVLEDVEDPRTVSCNKNRNVLNLSKLSP